MPKEGVEIPRHVSILPGAWPPRGGYLGDGFDAFKVDDPARPVPDVSPRVSGLRQRRRLKNLQVAEEAFARGAERERLERRTAHRSTVSRALRMMDSEQLKAFEVSQEPMAVQKAYGQNPFGRGCLAARRLIEVGVRCVEVTLGGWDTVYDVSPYTNTHINNHTLHRELVAKLDPAFATLIADLKQRQLLERTVVLVGGEFGRTPALNPAEGRDHWPHGFSVALAGGRLAGGRVIGQTDPAGGKKIKDPVAVEDLHATVMAALGIDHRKLMATPIGRPMRLSEGRVLKKLMAG